MFEELKRKPKTLITNKKSDKIFFMVDFENEKAVIKPVNEKGIQKDPEVFSTTDRISREILSIMRSSGEEKDFVIDWGGVNTDLYLEDMPYILELFKKADNIVDDKMKKISFSEGLYKISINLEESEEKITPTLFIAEGITEYRFISEKYILSDNKIYEIEDIGENYLELPKVINEFKKAEIHKYLSIIYSYFDNIGISYRDYNVVNGENEKAEAVLIIEKVDSDGLLHLNTGIKTAEVEMRILMEYDINTSVQINEMEEKIIVREIDDSDAISNIEKLSEKLVKHQKNLKMKDGFFSEGNLLVVKELLAKELFANELSFLLSSFAMFGSEKLSGYKMKLVKPKLGFKLSYNIDYFEGDAWVNIEGEKYSLFDIISSYNKNSYIPLNDGTNALISKNYIEKLERLFKKKKEGVNISFFDMPIVEELMEERFFESTFPKVRKIYDGFNNINEYLKEIPTINGELREYQKYGVQWMRYLYDNNLGGCLADDMGLGKTVQTITLLSSIYSKTTMPSIIVMPKSLVYNWDNEIKKFNPSISVHIYYGNHRDLEEAVTKNIIITTYGTLRSDIEKLKDYKFHLMILDESQNIKNMNSQIYKAALLMNTEKKLALSGTPVENNLSELYSLFSFLNPSMFGGVAEFSRNYGIPIQKDNDETAMNQLRKKIYPFILRRTKKEVLKDLPDKIEQVLYVEMSEEHNNFYNERRDFYKNAIGTQVNQHGIEKSQFFIFQALGELRQIATNPESKSDGLILSPKRELLIENIMDAVSNNHKVLVFTNYISILENISKDLEDNGIEYLNMTGATKDRQGTVDKFQKQKKYKVLIMTLKTGGVGLNLTEADTVFIYDPWWNRAAEMQAVDRTHRIGQKNTVFSYKLITKGTIEEKILTLQEKKKELFESLISSDTATAKNMTAEDIEYILGD